MSRLKGFKHSEETRKKLSKAHLGKKIRYVPRKTKGNNHWNWQGGLNNTNEGIRKSVEYKLWRKSVLERDKYVCIWCGNEEKLQADHIKPFASYPELRFAIDNGRTLCFDCHKTTNTFGGFSRRK